MNKMLAQYGYLEGSPGLWRITPKGGEYAHEKHEHRGTGGHAHYNRDWTVTTYDDSIIDALKADIAANPNPPTSDYSTPAEEEEAVEQPEPLAADQRGGLSDRRKVMLFVAVVAVTVYGAKKFLPRAKRAWRKFKDRNATRPAGTDEFAADAPVSADAPITHD